MNRGQKFSISGKDFSFDAEAGLFESDQISVESRSVGFACGQADDGFQQICFPLGVFTVNDVADWVKGEFLVRIAAEIFQI